VQPKKKERNVRFGVLFGVLMLAVTAVIAVAASAATNPPAGYTTYTPVVYSSTTGAVRFVAPWGTGQGDPNCTPPSPWAIFGPYDAVACTTGGSFDARSKEFYIEIVPPAPPPLPAQLSYVNVAYSSSTGDARVVGAWGAGHEDANCTPPSPWAINGPYDGVPCTTGGSFDARRNEFYTELASSLPANIGPSVGVNGSPAVVHPPAGFTTYIPIAYNSTTGRMRFLTPWGTSQGDPNCTPPAPWGIFGPYDGTACTSGGVFDAGTNELYTELTF
jgi:hypothetical protein